MTTDNEQIEHSHGGTPENTTPGVRLRTERERRGLSLAQVAGEMHMDILVAAALEKDDYSPLGAPIFVKGHLRNYAKLLGLPADELISDYEQAATPQTPELMTNRPTVGSMDDSNANGAGLFIGISVFLVIILLAGLALWFYGQRNDTGISLPALTQSTNATDDVTFDSNVQHIDPLLSASNQPQITPDAKTESLPVTSGQTEQADESESSAINVPVAEPVVNTQVNTQAEANNPVANAPIVDNSGATNAVASVEPITLELTFTDDSWVEVYGADDRPLLYELGQAGQVRQLQVKPPVRIFLGNAPAVDVSVNGAAFAINAYVKADSTARFTLQGEELAE